MKNLIFWSIFIVPVVIAFIAWPWLIVPYLILGGIALGIYVTEFGNDADWKDALVVFSMPHVYFIARVLAGGL